MATYTVTTLNDSGSGSLRDAIEQINRVGSSSLSEVRFNVRGTISLASTFPSISYPTVIDGTTAPGYVTGGPPMVGIDCRGNQGLVFRSRANSSRLLGLSIGAAADSGVTLDAGSITVNVNYIGLDLNGAPLGNRSAGIAITPNSANNLIGLNPSGAAGSVANVISGNQADGIVVQGSSGNVIVANRIGTNPAGTAAIPNGSAGIFLTGGAIDNVIGGTLYTDPATGAVNNPTGNKGFGQAVFVVPPLGNLISGNTGYGIVINQASHRNRLYGNFVGTSADGNAAIGNGMDGVWINDSNDNSLIGCTLEDQPFVYYNVCSGNGGHGLRITDSNNVKVQANFFGIGANNGSIVANKLNGIMVEGSSQDTQVGGVIPLGNVSSGNLHHGIEVRDTVGGFVSFNTFSGIFAFQGPAANGWNGIMITSTGGNITLQTNVWSGNGGHGIEIAGDAHNVTADPNFVGTDTGGSNAVPNAGHGLVIGGTAHDNLIGGAQQSIMPRSVFSCNTGYGIAIGDQAYNNTVINNYVGLDASGQAALGNGMGGIWIGSEAHDNAVGGAFNPFVHTSNIISANSGSGLILGPGTSGNTVVANAFGYSSLAEPSFPNNGAAIDNQSSSNPDIRDNWGVDIVPG